MEITEYLWDKLWEGLANLNIHLGCFIIRWGLWMLISTGLLYFTWSVLHSRNRFAQIVTFIAASVFVFVLPLQYLQQIGAVYGFAIIIAILGAISMPPYLSYYLTPKKGQQIRLKWVIYGMAVILLILQLIVM